MPTANGKVVRDRTRNPRPLAEDVFSSEILDGPVDPIVGLNPDRLGFLDAVHPDVRKNRDRWETNMRRAEGGDDVMDELWRFDWESKPNFISSLISAEREQQKNHIISEILDRFPGEHYIRRRDAVRYINFMEAFASETVGHLMREAPAPENGLSFGTLGIVRRKQDIDIPRRAEQAYYSINGTGTDALPWDMFWSDAAARAMHTGYRWIYVEAPSVAPGYQYRELTGFRPWLVEWDPREVPNYLYRNGTLQYAVVRLFTRNPTVDAEGNFTNNDGQKDYLLLVRAGTLNLGPAFVEGGWWRFNSDKELLGHQMWRSTKGEIPMAPLIYNRSKEGIGKPGTTELGNAQVAFMNISSAADFDSFDTAGAIKFLEGVDGPGFNLAVEKINKGNRYVPLRNNQETNRTPTASDGSMSGAAADTFSKCIAGIFETVDRIKGQVLTSGPSASGLAQQGGFMQASVPRLALFASNVEACQNAVIAWLEMRWGGPKTNPSGVVKWSKKYKLIQLTTAGQSILQLEAIAGIRSATLDTIIISGSAQDEGFVADTAMATVIKNELAASAVKRDQMQDVGLMQASQPAVPGARSQNMPPEPAQTHNPTPNQLDGPEVA